jgi:hypothetical protein
MIFAIMAPHRLRRVTMRKVITATIAMAALFSVSGPVAAACPYDSNCLNNPYGAGSRYKADGLMNPYSRYGSSHSNQSWTHPYATDAPRIYDQSGNYRGRLSTNRHDPDSVSNPYGRYGNKYSPDSINNPYGAGNPYGGNKLYVVPQR